MHFKALPTYLQILKLRNIRVKADRQHMKCAVM